MSLRLSRIRYIR